jgi:hypothetical protein
LGRFDDQYYVGRRPNGIYVPDFTNWGKDKRFHRGFAIRVPEEATVTEQTRRTFGATSKLL